MADEGKDVPSRQRTLTEKGKEYNLSEGKKKFEKVRKKICSVEKTVMEEVSKCRKKEAHEQLEKLETLLVDMHSTLEKMVEICPDDDVLRLELENQIHIVDSSVSQTREAVASCADGGTTTSVKSTRKVSSHKSKSRRSSHRGSSRASTVDSLMLKLAEAETDLKQKQIEKANRRIKGLQERQILEMRHEEMKFKQKQECMLWEIEQDQRRMEEEEEVNKSQVKYKVLRKYYEEQELGSDDPGSDEDFDLDELKKKPVQDEDANERPEPKREDTEPYQPQFVTEKTSKVTPSATVLDTCENPTSSATPSSLLVQQKLLELLLEQNAPMVEIEKFTGNSLDFRMFMAKFESEVEAKVQSDSGKLNRLLNLTKGTLAHELIEPCLYMPNGYVEAKRLLRKEYDDDNRISLAYEAKVHNWPNVRGGKELRSFYLFLNKVHFSIKSPEFSIELNSQSNLRTLVSKLPQYAQDRWNREATSTYERKNKKPDFQKFLNFLDMESLVANNHSFSRYAMTSSKSVEEDTKPKRSFRNLSIRKHQQSGEKCLYCDMVNHELNSCFKFRKISVQDRIQFIQQHGLCFGCVKSTSHRAKDCKSRLNCTICSKLHATCLHNDKSDSFQGRKGNDERRDKPDEKDAKAAATGGKPAEPTEETKSACAATSLSSNRGENSSIAMSCVLVELVNPTTGKFVTVYCFLDSLSNTSFITSHVYDEVMEGSSLSRNPNEVVKLSTLSQTGEQSFQTVSGLRVRSLQRNIETNLPKLYKIDKLPVDGEDIMCRSELENWPHLRHLAKDIPNYNEKIPIGLLIGNDAPRLLEPHDVAKPDPKFEKSPYAVRYLLGWSGAGPNRGRKENSKVMNVKVKAVTETGASIVESTSSRMDGEDEIKAMLKHMYERDFIETDISKPMRSKEDEKFMQILERDTKLVDGRYFMPLPFRDEDNLKLPDNRSQARSAALRLQKRLNLPKNDQLKGKYIDFMNELLSEEQASKVPQERTSITTGFDNHCFLNYHDVKHPQKPDKFRVVFNASKEFEGQSLNANLLQGPTTELMSSQIGVLMRFRSEIYAFTADIKGMFNQTRVVEEHRKFLRFYWWDNEDLSGPPEEFEMNVHLFGGASSPGCCMYALKRTALDNRELFSEESAQSVLHNFYVDDILKSVPDMEIAKKLTVELCRLLETGGFVLTKFQSPQQEILVSLPEEKLASKISNFDLQDKNASSDPRVGALGLQWNIRNDTFEFRISIKDRPFTRRGLLASISSIYDPLGFAAPFLLPARRLLQELTKSKYGWDDNLSSEIIEKWIKWRNGLSELEKIQIDRCVKPKDFGKLKNVQLHGFSDASEYGYGASLYLRLENEKGEIHVSLIFGKARVVPLSGETIPRSELVASLLVAELSSMIESELEYENVAKFLWTDSEIVLAYLANQTSRFKTFVSNRIRKCLELSKLEDWHHVPTIDNPADHASRGLNPGKVDGEHSWFKGPGFLWQVKSEWPNAQQFSIEDDDPEIKKTTKVLTIDVGSKFQDDPMLKIAMNLSDWFSMKRRIACVIFMLENKGKPCEITVECLQKAEVKILSRVQRLSFEADYKLLLEHKDLSQNSPLAKLGAFLDPESGLLRVGGRITEASVDWNIKHPIIIPKFGPVTDAIILDCHQAVKHGGRSATLNEIRARGYWILHANAKVKHVISKCVRCRSMRGKYAEQKMAPLPKDRVAFEAPPMSYCGVDVFGNFIVKNGRKEEKRYCALFTDLVYRGVHIEVLNNLETDSFLCALRRFIARRGNIRLLRSDNGSNFRGAHNEIQKALKTMEPELRKFMLENGSDLEWKFNTPTASHHGGVWERQIATTRRVLESVLNKHEGLLNDQSFITLMTEVEAVVNCRPLTTETLSDPESLIPLSPFNLLTQKSKVVLPPPGNFDDRAELYTRKQWRRIQHLANEIWTRYRKEYLSQVQSYSKWTKNRRNLKIGDIVLMKDDSLHRNHWPLGRVVETYPDSSGLVRSVKIRMARENLKDNPKFFDRPISKLVLLIEHGEV